MSDKIDCLVYLKSKLQSELNKLSAGDAAQNIQCLLGTANNISDGFFAKIAPFYEPITPKFMLTVQTLNESIVSGSSSLNHFDDYVASLAAALQA